MKNQSGANVASLARQILAVPTQEYYTQAWVQFRVQKVRSVEICVPKCDTSKGVQSSD